MRCFPKSPLRRLGPALLILTLGAGLARGEDVRADIDYARRLQSEGRHRAAMSVAFAALRAAPHDSAGLGLQERSLAVLLDEKAKFLRLRADEILQDARKRRNSLEDARALCRAGEAAEAAGARKAAEAYFREAGDLFAAIACSREGLSRVGERTEKPATAPVPPRKRLPRRRAKSAPAVEISSPGAPTAPPSPDEIRTIAASPPPPSAAAPVAVAPQEPERPPNHGTLPPPPSDPPAPAAQPAEVPAPIADSDQAAVAQQLYLRGLAAYMRGDRIQARRLIGLAAGNAKGDPRYQRLLERMDRESGWRK